MILDVVKKALRITTDAYDELIKVYIESAKLDLGIAGIDYVDLSDSLIETAVILFVKIHFGDGDTARLEPLYRDIKAQLGMASGYTDWRR